MDDMKIITGDDYKVLSLTDINSGNRINDVYSVIVNILKNYNFSHPETDSKFILSHIIKTDNLNEVVNSSYEISPLESNLIKTMIIRRLRYEPIQYITGKCHFYNISLNLKKGVFIPRPETEILVENVLRKIKRYNFPPTVLDMCCGIGNIAISIAKNSLSRVIGVDIDRISLKCATENSLTHNLSDRILYLKSDLFSALPQKSNIFDIIVSNPPYIPDDNFDDLQPDIKFYEPKYALLGGEDGLDYIKQIINEATEYLKPNGTLYIEMDPRQRKEATSLMKDEGFKNIKTEKDLNGFDRVLYGVYKPDI